MSPLDRLAWLEQVARDAGLPASSSRIAVLLSRYINAVKGIAWPSQATLMAESGMSRRGLQMALATMLEQGHLEAAINKGRGATNQYRPILKNVHPTAQQELENAHFTAQQELQNAQSTAQQAEPKMRTPCRGGAQPAARRVRSLLRGGCALGCAQNILIELNE